jgi:hypothetical protein
MSWTFTGDIEEYADRAGPLLAARPAENTVSLTLIDWVRIGTRWSQQPMHFGWHSTDGRVDGAVSLTPPFPLLLAVLPEPGVAGLVEALRGLDAPVSGVNGDRPSVQRFADAWTAGTSLVAELERDERLYGLRRVCPPDPAPPGLARQAVPSDLELVGDWLVAFHEELALPGGDPRPTLPARVTAGLIWLWEDAAGMPVSLAGRHRPAGGVAGLHAAAASAPGIRGRGDRGLYRGLPVGGRAGGAVHRPGQPDVQRGVPAPRLSPAGRP